MSLAEFQRHLANLIVTPEVSAAARSEWRESTELDTRERQRIEAIAEDRGLETARTIHRFFRSNALTEGIPLSLPAFAPGQITLCLTAFWSAGAPASIYSHSESAAFASFVLAQLEAGALDNPVLADLLRYELAEIELQQVPKLAPAELDDPDHRPLALAPDLRVVAMQHDPTQLLTRARRELPLADVPLRPGWVLLRSRKRGHVESAPLVPALARLLLDCDATRSAVELADAHGFTPADMQALAAAGYVVPVEPKT